MFPRKLVVQIIGYVDAYLEGCIDLRRSTINFLFFLGS